MLISVLTCRDRITEVIGFAAVVNVSIIRDATLAAPIAEITQSERLENASLIYSNDVMLAAALSPAKVVNASAVNPLSVRHASLSPSKVINVSQVYSKTLQPDVETSYANLGGTGDRIGLISITTTASPGTGVNPIALVDGGFADTAADSYWWTSTQSGRTMTFDFGIPVLITEAKLYQDVSTGHGTWKWRGSNDNVDWIDLSANFTLAGGPAGAVQGDLSANTNLYRYYQLFQISGVTSSDPWQREWEFKIAGLIASLRPVKVLNESAIRSPAFPGAEPAQGWELVGSWDHAASGDTASPLSFINLAGFTEFLVMCDRVTLSIDSVLAVRVSTDNGVSFLASPGDYQRIGDDGVSVVADSAMLLNTALFTSVPHSGQCLICGADVTGAYKVTPKNLGPYRERIDTTTAPINALQVIASNGGNFTGGRVFVLAR
jgi:hypothetical protein